MKKISTLLVAAGLLASVSTASAQLRIPIQEEKPVEMYALGANNTMGVWKISLADLSNPQQLNSDYVQYTGTPNTGGGTFLNTETVVGVYKGTSYYYTYEATAAGKDGQPWAENYFNSSATIWYGVYDMTYDEQNDIIYCWYGATSAAGGLGIYNPSTQTITRVGTGSNMYMRAIAIDKDGQLWGVGNYGLLFKIDKTTGACTDLTNFNGVGVQFDASAPMSAAFDYASGVLYVVGKGGSYNTYSSLYKIDVTSIKAEKVGDFANGKYYNCLYVAGSTLAAGAPAEVENLTAEFNGEATVVSFTAPTLNTGGKNLTGDLTYSVAVDGEEAATGTVQPGASVSVNINPADGLHEIQVSVSNSEGASKAVKTSVYSGYDQPTAVTNLKAVAEGNDVVLTWDAPTGKNGGMVDTSKLSYKVSSNGTVLATGLTATSYTAAVEDYYAEHTYTVTVVYNEADGDSQSASVMVGNAYQVPVSLNLNLVPSLGAAGITVLDPNTDNDFKSATWELVKAGGDAYLQSYSAPSFCRSDYVYMPKVSLKAGVPYTITFKAMVTTTTYFNDKTADVSVLIAKEPTYVADDYSVLKNYIIPVLRDNLVWEDYTVDFTVDTNGDYFLGLLDYAGSTYTGYHYLYVKDLAIDTNLPTPEAVSDLAATAQADNKRNIDITFTLPTKDTKGEDLTEITKVEIYRGTELLETIEGDLTPGQAISYPDEEAPRGENEYSVVVYSGEQASEKATVTAMAGYLKNLAIELLAAPEGPVKPNGGGTITVKVTNDGAEEVTDGEYTVVLYHDGTQVESLTGTTLASDASKDYSFTLNWTGNTPQTVQYIAKVEYTGDENTADNETAPISVSYSSTSGVDDAVCAELEVIAVNGHIAVKGAEGKTVTVYAADGRTIVSATATAEYTTPALPRGVYVVCAGTAAVKVAL